MKKSMKKIICVLLCVVTLITSFSIMSFAEGADDATGEFMDSISLWFGSLSSYDWSDFNEFVTAVLRFFGFQGDYEGVHSIPVLADEWFSWFGDLGSIYESIINYVDAGEFLSIIYKILGMA